MWDLLTRGVRVRLKCVAGFRLDGHLQLLDMCGILVPRLVQLAVLTQGLVVHGQHHRLHVHARVVRDGHLREAGREFWTVSRDYYMG